MVVGGGPGGLKAAHVAALRGHQVTLYEKTAKLGGQFNLAIVPPMKQELSKMVKYLSIQVEKAGVEVIEARISHLAYAQEIASAMLKRQQAQAIVAARTQIVDGAVGMVKMALNELREQGVVDLDEERKANMVSNLLVVLCGEENARPVVNTGSLYG